MTSFSEHVCKKYINLKYFFFFYFEQQRQRCQTLLLKYLISWILNCSFLEAKTSLLSISTQNRVVQTLQLNNTCCMSERNLDVRVCFASSMVHKFCWREIPLSFKIKKKKKKHFKVYGIRECQGDSFLCRMGKLTEKVWYVELHPGKSGIAKTSGV